MATSKDYIDYLFERLNNCENVRVRPMMGEYLLYYKDKLVGDICDNRVFIKPVDGVKDVLPEAELLPPYCGAKPHVAV
ncbi:MAG: competence protein TfoX, partial [Clostridia bacterium]|nr:competence protein TfoX [Clostridia bacterium]